MIKLTLQSYWQPEDDLSAIMDNWIAAENAKIPADIRESLRGFFPHIGIFPEEADLIPESVAQYITMHSPSYQTYRKNHAADTQTGTPIEKRSFEQTLLARLQARYVLLEFYTAFVEMVRIAKRADVLYVKASSVKVKLSAPDEQESLQPKTEAEDELFSFLAEIEQSLRNFESVVPVEIVRYIGHESYQIPSDTLSSYRAVEDLPALSDLKKQAEAFFDRYGYVQTGRNTFAPKYDTKEPVARTDFKGSFLTRLQELYALLAFYAAFVESLQIAKDANDFYTKTSSIKVKSDLFDRETDLRPKTAEEEQLLAFLVEVERALCLFETLMPVEVARYIDYDIYQITGDSLSTYHMASEMFALLDLKKQAETLFCIHDTRGGE